MLKSSLVVTAKNLSSVKATIPDDMGESVAIGDKVNIYATMDERTTFLLLSPDGRAMINQGRKESLVGRCNGNQMMFIKNSHCATCKNDRALCKGCGHPSRDKLEKTISVDLHNL